MTIHHNNRQPLSVSSSKIIDWLVNRKLVRKDYPRLLSALKTQIGHLSEPTNFALADCLYKRPSYLLSLRLTEFVESQDTETDFLGRASQTVRSWRDVLNSYKKDNLYLAEIGEDIHELASEHIPRCKSIISDRQKLVTNLHQKMKELCLSSSKLEEATDKKLKMLHLTPGDANVKRRLLEEAANVPVYLENVVQTLGELESVVSFYSSMRGYVHQRASCEGDVQDFADTTCCSTLRLLISCGHVPLYHWRTGQCPEHLGQNDDFVPALLEKELQSLMDNSDGNSSFDQHSVFLDVEDPVATDVDWVDDDSCALIELSDTGQPEAVLVDSSLSLDPANSGRSDKQATVSASVISGPDARLLLDTVDGRNALLNDLTELWAFLTCFIEGQIELHGLDCEDLGFHGSKIRSSAAYAGGSTTLQNMIMENAPPIVQSVSARDAVKMLAAVECTRDQLTNSRISQLFMIRNKPGYLDRLVSSISDLKAQLARAKARMNECQLRIQEAYAEQEIQTAALTRYRALCRELVGILEKELTRICDRPVQIVGPVLDL